MIRHGGLSAIHQSDPECLASLKAKHDGARDESEAAKLGTMVHAAAEALTYASTLEGTFNPLEVATQTIQAVAERTNALPETVAQAVEMMEHCLDEEDGLRFFVEEGSTVHAEWRWALDEDFSPIPLDPETGESMDGREIAYAGTVDRLQVFEDPPRIIVGDYKSVIPMMAQWEVAQLWQARLYVFAVLQHFPAMREAFFRIIQLRHRYYIQDGFTRGDPWERSTVARMRYERSRRLAAIRDDEWPETLGEGCQWCPIVFKCGAMAQALEQGELPDEAPADLARRHMAVGKLAGRLKREAEKLYKSSGPIDLGDGSVFGGKPVQKWELDNGYEETLAELRIWGMTPAQETEWFRFVRESDMPGRVRSALREILGREAKAAIEEGGIVSPIAKTQLSRWWPDGKP